MDHYLQFTILGMWIVDWSGAYTIRLRRYVIQSITLLGEERKHLCRVLNSNGYPNIRSSTATYPSRQEPNKTPIIITYIYPYISGVSENIRKLCRGYKIKWFLRLEGHFIPHWPGWRTHSPWRSDPWWYTTSHVLVARWPVQLVDGTDCC